MLLDAASRGRAAVVALARVRARGAGCRVARAARGALRDRGLVREPRASPSSASRSRAARAPPCSTRSARSRRTARAARRRSSRGRPAGRLCIVTSDLGRRVVERLRALRARRRAVAVVAIDAALVERRDAGRLAASAARARARRGRGRRRARAATISPRTLAPLVDERGRRCGLTGVATRAARARADLRRASRRSAPGTSSRLQSPGARPRRARRCRSCSRSPVALAARRRPPRARASRSSLWLVGDRGARRAGLALARPPARAVRAAARSRCTRAAGASRRCVLPFDPVAEPGLHALLLAGVAVWLLALALVWLVAARPLPDGRARRAAASRSSRPSSRCRGPGLRVALLVALVVLDARRSGAAPARARRSRSRPPLVLIALVGAELPGLARASFLDWHAWGQRSRRLELRRGDRRPLRLGPVATTGCTTRASPSSSCASARRGPRTGG